MTTIQPLSSGGFVVTDKNNRTTYCATLADVYTLLQNLYGV